MFYLPVNRQEQMKEAGCQVRVCPMKRLLKNIIKGKKGQSLIEYALVISLVSAAAIAMSTYVYRSVQATQKFIEEDMRQEFGN